MSNNYYKKRTLSFCLISLIFILSGTELNAQFSGGDGTSNNPYQISTLDDLIKLGDSSQYWAYGTYFIQTTNIDATRTDTLNGGLGFKPIGTEYSVGQSFSGSYNGNGYSIYNLYINRPNKDYVGLFGATYPGDIMDTIIIVQNLSLIDAHIVGKDNVGGLVGFNVGRIINCFISGSVTGNNIVGGIANFSRGIINCRSEVNVNGNNDVGGLVGQIAGTPFGYTIMNSSASGEVKGKSNVGGLAGSRQISLGSITPICYAFATGNVTGEENVGGLVGQNSSEELSKCYATGIVIGKNKVGGLIGENMGELFECYATGYVSGLNNVGGLVGDNRYKIYNCYSLGKVNGVARVGGFTGTSQSFFTNCYTTSTVQGDSNVGGFAGRLSNQQYNQNNYHNHSYSDTHNVVGLTLSEMHYDSNFVGFNFDTIWAIHPLINCGYPYLQAIPPGATDTISSVTDNSRCGKGKLLLEVTAPSGEINWYDSASRGEILFTGDSFETPYLDSSTVFWAELKNEYCAMPRREVLASLFVIDVNVNQIVDTLFAIEDNAAYQWLDCGDNFKPISGAILKTFVPETTGSYAVEITKNSCIDTSSCLLMYIGNVFIADKSHLFSIYPNPAINHLTIEVFEDTNYTYKIIGIKGNIIANGNLQNGENIIDISTISAGVYFVHLLIDGNLIITYKVIKQTE